MPRKTLWISTQVAALAVHIAPLNTFAIKFGDRIPATTGSANAVGLVRTEHYRNKEQVCALALSMVALS